MGLTAEDFIAMAKESGFTAAGVLDPSTIELRQEVRDMCAEDKCHAYGHNWTCPPHCGTLEECRGRIKKYQTGIIVQTTGQLEDSLDYEAMMDTAALHKKNLVAFFQKVQETYPNALCLGAGGCSICEKCSCPDSPCRFPQKAFSSMEGYGMVVSDVCKNNGIPYYYGENTITYVGCYLLY